MKPRTKRKKVCSCARTIMILKQKIKMLEADLAKQTCVNPKQIYIFPNTILKWHE